MKMPYALAAVMALGLLALAAPAHARSNEDLQPRPVSPLPRAAEALPVSAAVSGSFQTLQGPALGKLVISHGGENTPAPTTGIVVVDIPELDTPALTQLLTPFLGQPITLNLLNEITRAIVVYYQDTSHALVDVVAPAGQDITDGTVRIMVIEGHLGSLTARGNAHFSSRQITGPFRTKPGDAINSQTMLEDLNWVNRNPFRRVDLLYRRGQNLGETDAILTTIDRKTERIYGGIDDTGTDLTGNMRMFAGFNLGNLFCCGHQLNYQFTASDDLKKMSSHALSYTNPLPWRHLLTLYASHQQVKPDVAAPLKSDGYAYDLGALYTIPLASTETSSQDLTFGYDFKRNNNNLAFGGTQVFNTSVDVSQFSAAYSVKRDDTLGSTELTGTLTASPGGLTDKNSDAAYATARAASSAQYLYAVARLERTTRLPGDFTLATTAELQLANDRLPGSEEMTAGGYRSVRGYDEGETAGDNGFMLRNELRGPTANPLADYGVADSLTVLGFMDFATVSKRDALAGETPRNTLLSIGPGLRYRVGDNMDFRLDYGMQLRNSQSGNHLGVGQRAHAALTLSY